MNRFYVIDGITGELIGNVFDAPDGKQAAKLFLLHKGMLVSNWEIKAGENRYHVIATNKYDPNMTLQVNQY